MKITQLEPIPPNENPFVHDAFNMGQRLSTNLWIMYGNHTDQTCLYLILVDTNTGKRTKLQFEKGDL